MTANNDLKDLIITWKEDDMYATQELLKVGRLDRDVRSQSVAALLVGLFTVGAVGWLWKEALMEARTDKLLLAVFMTGFAAVFVRITLRVRERAAKTEALLAGPPLDVLAGRRAHLNMQVCGVTQPRYVAFNLSVFPILIGMSAFSMLTWTFTVPACIGYGAYLLYVALVRLPRQRRELAVVDELMAELRGE